MRTLSVMCKNFKSQKPSRIKVYQETYVLFQFTRGHSHEDERLTLFDMGFFEQSVMGAPHHNFVVIALMITKFGTGIKLDVFYTKETKNL